jgi:hypothetical protein
MWPSVIEVQDIGLEETVELYLMPDQEMIQACASVSGWTSKSASCPVRTILARSSRSVCRETAGLISRRRMSRRCRNRAFAASSAALPLGIAASVASKREVVGGLMQRETRAWIT